MFCHLSGAENSGVNPHNTAAMMGEAAGCLAWLQQIVFTCTSWGKYINGGES